MTDAAWRLDERSSGTLHLSGDWTALAIGEAALRLSAQPGEYRRVQRLDLSDLGRIDSAGALVLLRSMAPEADIEVGDREDLRRLIDLVRPALEQESPRKAGTSGLLGVFERIGRQLTGICGDAYQMLDLHWRAHISAWSRDRQSSPPARDTARSVDAGRWHQRVAHSLHHDLLHRRCARTCRH